MDRNLVEAVQALGKSDSALLSVFIVFVATLLNKKRIKSGDVELWIVSLERYVAAKANDPESDASIVRKLIERLHQLRSVNPTHPPHLVLQ